MTTESKLILEKYRFVLDTQSFSPAPGYDLKEVYDVIVKEIDPNYTMNWYCSYCLIKMVEFALNNIS